MNATIRCILTACAVSLALPATARADNELPSARTLAMARKVCERAWPKQEQPRSSVTRLCAQYWLFAYNYSLSAARSSGVADALASEPRVTGVEVTRFTRSQFLSMAKHARKLPRRTRHGEDWIAIRAREYFEGAAESKLSLTAAGVCQGTLDCLLQRIFTDKKLAADSLTQLGAVHLVILRNAVYARHGRRFDSRDLVKLFYTDVAARQSGGLLPRQQKRGFRDDMLSANDQANLAAIDEARQRVRKEFKRTAPRFLREDSR